MNETPEETIKRLAQEKYDLLSQIVDLQTQLSDDQAGFASRLQEKVARQRRALDILNRKVLSQRFRLRLLSELGRDVTKEEYLEAKERIENEQVKARILDHAPVG